MHIIEVKKGQIVNIKFCIKNLEDNLTRLIASFIWLHEQKTIMSNKIAKKIKNDPIIILAVLLLITCI